ncbi:MAG: aminopeptidase P family protein [Vicinamibacterales bacterium]
MFSADTYRERRTRLAQSLGAGLVLLPGHHDAPINYTDNVYPFRQDSTFLYFFGLDRPDLAGVLDAGTGEATVYGDELTVDDVIWTGPQPRIAEQAAQVGVTDTAPRQRLAADVASALQQGRQIHILPPYRADTARELSSWLRSDESGLRRFISSELIARIVELRSRKSSEEVAELELALQTTHDMHVVAMQRIRPGVTELEVVAAIEHVARAQGRQLSFPPIVTIHGETLHNTTYRNRMERGQLAVNDSGAESPRHYAGDITRTIPVGGRFEGAQRELYAIVLGAQQAALDAIRPGVPYKTTHLLASRVLASGLSSLGCLRGNLDDAVDAGAHALFLPHGLGHMLGLDVHDMEALGETHVGYDSSVQRSEQFGLRSLRLARRLEVGFTLTVEPGLYFIPALIDKWRAEGRCRDFIDYDAVERLRFAGGIRIEDNIVVTPQGARVLGPPIPKALNDVEALAGM